MDEKEKINQLVNLVIAQDALLNAVIKQLISKRILDKTILDKNHQEIFNKTKALANLEKDPKKIREALDNLYKFINEEQ